MKNKIFSLGTQEIQSQVKDINAKTQRREGAEENPNWGDCRPTFAGLVNIFPLASLRLRVFALNFDGTVTDQNGLEIIAHSVFQVGSVLEAKRKRQ